jgi:FkbM family methyltransferase
MKNLKRDGGLTRRKHALTPDDLVIDVGAYTGEWSERIYELYGCRIIAIEPTPYIKSFAHGQIINKAASDHDGTIEFAGAYYHTSAYADPEAFGTRRYPCFDINRLLESQNEIAVLKMNVEGHEYDLLAHIISANLHLRVRNWQIQFHQIEGKPYKQWYDLIVAELDKSHHRSFTYPMCWEGWMRQ